ncbi:hypothetical protein Krac_5683 [Ktedonobacter racemifer DSM 44963]|uniref:Uncharacterized protein n=1 Tax=Ktedonobacter racemifer DSM 44963 TaxID=485913 RepID=D6TWL9_KTERA|nr:hypothetical protein Krac_5683 [Ktedonobacter racemifer DSM 44963]
MQIASSPLFFVVGFFSRHMAVFGEKLEYIRRDRLCLLIDNDTLWRNSKRGVISGAREMARR